MVQFSKRRLAPLRRDDVPFSDSVYTTAGPNQDARLDRRRLYLHLITVKMQGCVLCVLPIDTKFSPATLPQRKPLQAQIERDRLVAPTTPESQLSFERRAKEAARLRASPP
ncbi:hypothetical protein PaG_02244 [Moesziomyces aphidis]|jgi:hypothetical protein|uniref:Uncharacterized protein n=1 Tax=Moesziomyces aphidis TaxID=84754 RepID=W3VQH7_MOEAP|nr:hypothetical protein PaG_02244 [Moesziomyces aphidis]